LQLVRTLARLLIVSAILSTACAETRSVTAPTAAVPISSSASTDLTVRVLTRGGELPIAGATVFQNSTAIGITNRVGELRTNVHVDVEFHIEVSAPGYLGFDVAGTVRGAERWTFYLESAGE
jgi:hypothetical protein